MSNNSDLSETVACRLTKKDLALVEKTSNMRGEDPSSFVRRMMRKGFAELGFLDNEEKKALGITI